MRVTSTINNPADIVRAIDMTDQRTTSRAGDFASGVSHCTNEIAKRCVHQAPE